MSPLEKLPPIDSSRFWNGVTIFLPVCEVQLAHERFDPTRLTWNGFLFGHAVPKLLPEHTRGLSMRATAVPVTINTLALLSGVFQALSPGDGQVLEPLTRLRLMTARMTPAPAPELALPST